MAGAAGCKLLLLPWGGMRCAIVGNCLGSGKGEADLRFRPCLVRAG
jgi:hypothetical protein